MSMTKKDYEAIARAFKSQREEMPASPHPGDKDAIAVHHCTHFLIAATIADYCASQSPSFDRARFLKACGIEE